MKYFIHLQQEEGPFSYEELQGKRLSKDTPAWHEGLQEWTTAGEIAELKGLFGPEPPPFQKAKTTQPPPFGKTGNEPKATKASSMDEVHEVAEEYPWQEKKKRLSSGAMIALSAGALVVLVLAGILLKNSGANNLTAASSQGTYVTDSTTSANNELQRLKQAEEQRRARNEQLTKKNMEIRNNWQRYFKASTSSYHIDGFGGISDLTVYFDNLSDYTVDEMTVRVYYYLANGNLHGSNDAVVYNLTPGERKSFRVPDTGRGIKAEIQIMKVAGSKFHFLYSEDYSSGNPEDPYYLN